MPNIKSAKKRLRTNAAAQVRNSHDKTRVRSASRQFREAVASGDAEASTKAYTHFCSMIDKAAKRNVVKKNTAVRSKSRAAARLRELTK